MIAVVGAGAFGTALAIVWARAGRRVRLVARTQAAGEALKGGRQNAARLPGIPFPPSLEVGTDVGAAELVAYVMPAQSFTEVLQRHPVPHGALGVICAKGIDTKTGHLLPRIATAVRPGTHFAVLSGPGFADEIARGLPTAMTLAAEDLELASQVAQTLSDDRFRLYASDDMHGVAAGGALKNVAAIACGLSRGLALGASAEAALATRAWAELAGLVRALGGRAETFAGLSGLGDLMLTCSSTQSRNFRFGRTLGEAGAWTGELAEGVYTTEAAVRLADQHSLDLPIVRGLAETLKGTNTPSETFERLMNRPLRTEV